jgi:hypothetical protein
MRCDLHVHTVHSGMCTVPVLSRVCRESYNEPAALYETFKRRGMGLVTVTDHDSIDASEELRSHPDFFLSEEVPCTMPSGARMHAGVYGISERDHIELQRRRTDIQRLLAYALERRLFVTVNHLYSSLTGTRDDDDFAARFNKPRTGGSDAHTLDSVARTFTEIPSVYTAEDFLTALRRGRGIPRGQSGDYWKLTGAVMGIGGSLIAETPWMAAFGALFALVPAVTFANHLRELAFAWYWTQRNRPVEPDTLPDLLP